MQSLYDSNYFEQARRLRATKLKVLSKIFLGFAFEVVIALFLRLFYNDNFCCNFTADRPSFANAVKNSREPKVERPNCLNLKHRNLAKEMKQ